MGRAADRACIQYRILNRGRAPLCGPCGLQADRREYQKVMKHTLELQENLWVKQAEVVGDPYPGRRGVRSGHPHRGHLWCEGGCRGHRHLSGGRTIVGEVVRDSGPDGLAAALPPDPVLGGAGAVHPPLQDGDAPRVNARSVDFSKLEVQPGTRTPSPSPFYPGAAGQPGGLLAPPPPRQRPTPLSGPIWTAPLFSGVIEGVGPRYCPLH